MTTVASRLQQAIDLLDAGLGKQHDGYQLYVSVHGETLLDHAGGEARPGVPMTPDSLMLWFSSTKPLTAVAIGQLWERGKLALDDRVTAFIPEFAGGKERATIRHLLTHRGGFPTAGNGTAYRPDDWEERVAEICAAPAEWEPGTAAGYHGTSGHLILGEIVRRIDGRPVERYMREEILDPLGMRDSHLGIPAELVPALRDRVSHVRIKFKVPDDPAGAAMMNLERTNEDERLSWVSPGASGRGPAHDLGKLYEALIGGGERQGVRILGVQTVEAITACHRRGMVDRTFEAGSMPPHPKWGYEVPWGLSVMLDGNVDVGGACSPRVFGHSGALSSVGFGDPETGLACAIITNGLIPLDQNAVRLGAAADAVNRAIRA